MQFYHAPLTEPVEASSSTRGVVGFSEGLISMQCINLGDFELTAVSDGIYHLDGGGMFGVVPKSLWERKVKSEGNNLVPLGLNSLRLLLL